MGTKQQVRHNPPQLAAIITACVIPMIGVVAYVIFFTDLSQQVRRLLVRFVQWFNAQPWESIGHTTLIVLLWTVGILAVIIGVASTGRVFGILNKWSLSTGELIRVTLAAIYCISADIACMICTIQFLGLKFIGWALSLPNRSGAFFGIMAIPVVGFIVAFDFLLVVFSVTGAYPLESSPDMVSRLLLPKYCKIYCQWSILRRSWQTRQIPLVKHIISMTCTGLDFLTEKAVTSGLWTIGTYWKSMRRITL